MRKFIYGFLTAVLLGRLFRKLEAHLVKRFPGPTGTVEGYTFGHYYGVRSGEWLLKKLLGKHYPVPDEVDTSNSPKPNFDMVPPLTKDDAHEVVTQLMALTNEYGYVSIADFHDLVGIPSVFKDHQWGWTDLDGVSIVERKDGWAFCFPPTVRVQ